MLRFLALAVALVAAWTLGLFVGGAALDPGTVALALTRPHGTDETALIVWTLRVQRVAIAALVGATLGSAGFLLQGLVRNPIADPYLTGVSAGAAVAVAAGIVGGLSATITPGVATAAGLASALLVGLLARRAGGLDADRLVLAGFAISTLLAGVLTLIELTHSPDADAAIVGWLAGSIADRGWHDLAAVAPYAAAGFALAAATVPALNALRLGPELARSVGVDVARAQWLVLAAVALLTAAAVALSGIVGFVGLIVPHVARRIVGGDARVALPATAMLGATLVPLADAVARSIAPPIEIPLGVVLAFVGVPAFFYFLRRRRNERAWAG